jgi:tetrapyrrole methylase family protein/MazG family protein
MSDHPHTITIVGLGPGDIGLLTLEASDVLNSVDRIYLRTAVHPIVDVLKDRFPHLEVVSFDEIYESAASFDEVYGEVVARLMRLVQDQDVTYCVPGSPSVSEATVNLIRKLATSDHVPVRIVHAISFIEPVLAAAGDVDIGWLSLMDAVEIDLLVSQNAFGEVPGLPGRLPYRSPVPTAPLLITQMYSTHIAASVKLWLGSFWHDEHECVVIHSAGTASEKTERVPIYRIDRLDVDHLTSLYVPPLQPTEDVRTFAGLLNVTRALRAPGGCPWDREQSHDSLKTHLLEETYEVLETLDEHAYDHLAEELGDLLFQITIHSQIAAEYDEFTIEDVISSITTKLIRRHPHVFGEISLKTSSAVLQHWESFKQAEKPTRESILSGIPEAMPALPYSYAVQKRVANQGFDWPDIGSLLSKVEEELNELRATLEDGEGRQRVLDELGDLLFVLVSVGRRLKIDPEEALRRANRKFANRFRHVERQVKSSGENMRDLSPEHLDRLWDEAKTATEQS